MLLLELTMTVNILHYISSNVHLQKSVLFFISDGYDKIRFYTHCRCQSQINYHCKLKRKKFIFMFAVEVGA